jgi:hypothetical protein
LLASSVAVLVAFAFATLARGDDAEKVPLPKAKDFSKLVLAVARSYPTDGTHRYYWPKSGTWPGTTRDVLYMGTRVCEADEQKRCFCCGITFEVFVRAYEKYCADAKKKFRILDLDADGVLRLRREWFGPTAKDRHTVEKAITMFKLGRSVKLEDAQPGDFCQLWRHSGSGHSVVVLSLEKDASGTPVSLRYWSAQGSTNGIGEHSERFSDEKSGVIAAETYVARVGTEDWR